MTALARMLMTRGTAAALTSDNPILVAGELGVETDTGRLKIGDGVTAWTSLGYVTGIAVPLTVPNGGTGVATLTGYVKGNGASAMTASPTVPNTDVSGLGTMSTQASSNVSITGGAVSGLTAFTVGSAAGGNISRFLDGAAATTRTDIYRTGSSSRWQVGANATAEGGSDAGSNFDFARFSDAGAFLGFAIRIIRSTGALTLFSQEIHSGIQTANLAANTDNLALTATTRVLRLTAGGAFNLTGITGGADGRRLTLLNVDTADTITLTHDATSTAANRFYCPAGANLAVRRDGGVELCYDGTSSRWRVVAP